MIHRALETLEANASIFLLVFMIATTLWIVSGCIAEAGRAHEWPVDCSQVRP